MHRKDREMSPRDPNPGREKQGHTHRGSPEPADRDPGQQAPAARRVRCPTALQTLRVRYFREYEQPHGEAAVVTPLHHEEAEAEGAWPEGEGTSSGLSDTEACGPAHGRLSSLQPLQVTRTAAPSS